MLYDHVDFRVGDLNRVRKLYDALLPAMGYRQIAEDEASICYYTPGRDRSEAFFAIDLDRNHKPNGTRIALRAADRNDVDRLAEIARQNGATAFEAPHVCTEYTPLYYATFFEDAEGNKLEICYRENPV